MRAVVVLSGGLDSAVALKVTADEGGAALALTFDYGQRAARREIAAAEAMCRRLDVQHEAVSLPWLAAITQTALVSVERPVPVVREETLDAPRDELGATAASVWVPNRNGVFVNVAAAYAEALNCDVVVAGFNAEEGATFPDNSAQYVQAASCALKLSTLSGVRVESPTIRLSKREIVELGRRVLAPLELVWSCYHGGERHCFVCESCVRLKRALTETGNWEWWLSARAEAAAAGQRAG